MITDTEWQEMKVAEKREWLRSEAEDTVKRIDNLVYGIERIWVRQRKLLGRMHKVEAMLGIASPSELVAVAEAKQ